MDGCTSGANHLGHCWTKPELTTTPRTSETDTAHMHTARQGQTPDASTGTWSSESRRQVGPENLTKLIFLFAQKRTSVEAGFGPECFYTKACLTGV